MPRFTPRRGVVFCATALLVALSLAACAPTNHDLVYSGSFSLDDPIRLDNHTITSGRYLVSYSMDVLVASNEPVPFACTVVDPSGTIEFFGGLGRPVAIGRWVHLEAEGSFDLPDLTLGLRCSPPTETAMTVVFRNVVLNARPA
ncbi:MAG: hypothetical protein ABJA94_05570 [Rhodoglobus sp.]